MNYTEYQKLTVSQKQEFLFNSVKFLIQNLNRLRVSYDATPYTIEEGVDSDNGRQFLVIKCPFDTLAWKLALLLEASTILAISVDRVYVHVE